MNHCINMVQDIYIHIPCYQQFDNIFTIKMDTSSGELMGILLVLGFSFLKRKTEAYSPTNNRD